MSKKAIAIVVFLIVVLVGIQWIPPTLNKSKALNENDLFLNYSVPKGIELKIKSACYDCHSNNTFYPWYADFQPFRLIIDKHVVQGKKELNFNEFMLYSNRRKRSKLNSVINQIENKEMPLSSYQLLHSNARINEQEMIDMISWLKKIKDNLD